MPKKRSHKFAHGMMAFALATSTFAYAGVSVAVHAEDANEQVQEENGEGLLELATIADIRAVKEGEVKTKGVVTAAFDEWIHIQDETGAISIQRDAIDVEQGDVITVSGNLQEQNGVLFLDQAVIEEKTNGNLPQALRITSDQLENHLSELVTLSEVTVTKTDRLDGHAVYSSNDDHGSFHIVDPTNGFELEENTVYESITGITVIADGGNYIVPRTAEDIVLNEQEQTEEEAVEEVVQSNDANNENLIDDEENTVPADEQTSVEQKENRESEPTSTEEGEVESSQDENEQDLFDLSILHMNDTHAHVDRLPSMVTAINENRKDNSLVLHAGDVFSGTLYFTEFNGKADLALLNLMNIDAMTFGNHEFDLGSPENGHQSLSNFVSGANFPFLGANIDFSGDPFMSSLETNQHVIGSPQDGMVYNSIVKEIDGEQVGIFGLTTEDTANIASPADVVFHDFKESAEEAVENFEEAGIDKVVALTHIGFNSAPRVGNDLRLASEVDGIDVIVGGHSHTALEAPQVVETDVNGEEKDPTVIVQAGANAEYLGTVDVTFDDHGVITDYEGELLSLDNYEGDPTAVAELQEYKEVVDGTMNEEIGAEAMKELANPRQNEPGEDSVRANETELGNLITDAMLAGAQEKYPETVIAVQNGGGIRAPIEKGPITAGEVISVLPFGNNPVVAMLTGEEIKDILEHSVSEAPSESGGFLHVSGMRFYFDSTQDPGNRIVKMYVVKDDCHFEEIKLDEEYMVTTNGFTGQGGDGFTTFEQAFNDGRVKDIGESDWQQLRDYMVEDLGGIVDPEREGRIIDLKGEQFTGIEGCEIEEDGQTPTPTEPVDNEKEEEQSQDDDPNSSEEKKESEDGKENDESTEDMNDEETTNEETNDEETEGNGDSTTGSGNDEQGGPSGTSSIESGTESTTDRSLHADTDVENDETLPKTATNMFTVFAIGSALLASGVFLHYFRRKSAQ